MEIENYREQPPGSYVHAIFDIYIPAWQCRFRNFKMIRSKKGGVFIAGPQFSQEDSEGKKQYIPLIEFSKERGEEFQKKVLELLKNFTPHS